MRPDNPLIVQPDRTLMLHTVQSCVGPDGQLLKDEEGRPLTEEHARYAEATSLVSQGDASPGPSARARRSGSTCSPTEGATSRRRRCTSGPE